MLLREELAGFIEAEGHRTEVSLVDESRDLAEIVFRTRGQMFSVALSELEPRRVRISTAYEVPDLVRDRSHTLDALAEVEAEYPGTHFMLAHDDTIFIASLDLETEDMPTLVAQFWRVVGRLRDAGTAAVERMVDRSESKAAADKFIRQFMKGDR